MNKENYFKRYYSSLAALSMIEVVIAVFLASMCVVPIFYMVTSSRTDTSKAINYLRAVELANEVIDWISVAEWDSVENMDGGYLGSLVEGSAGSLSSVVIAAGTSENPQWKNSSIFVNSAELKYSEQYNSAFFYRKIDVKNTIPNLLRKITVTVSWAESQKPSNIGLEGDRDRYVELSVLLLNDSILGL